MRSLILAIGISLSPFVSGTILTTEHLTDMARDYVTASWGKRVPDALDPRLFMGYVAAVVDITERLDHTNICVPAGMDLGAIAGEVAMRLINDPTPTYTNGAEQIVRHLQGIWPCGP